MIPNQMQYTGLKTTENFEGLSLKAYRDTGGVWTNGYGNTVGVTADTPDITQEQAEADLARNIAWAVKRVNDSVNIQLTQGEFNALVDFVFNVGVGNFASSTLLRLINQGDLTDAVNEFVKWDHCGGQVVAGLLRRRQAEAAEFVS